jgi:hypothetical protein
MLNVIIQQLLSETQLLAAVFNSLRKLIVLEKEKNVLLLDILIVLDDEGLDLLLELVGGLAQLFFIHLITVQIVFQKSMIEVDLSQFCQFFWVLGTNVFDDIL